MTYGVVRRLKVFLRDLHADDVPGAGAKAGRCAREATGIPSLDTRAPIISRRTSSQSPGARYHDTCRKTRPEPRRGAADLPCPVAAWSRARRAVAEARERAAAKRPAHRRGRYPSRIPADWRPQVVEKTQPDLSIHQRAPSSPTVRVESVPGEAGARPNNEIVEFPTVDPSGAPLPDGHVFYRGQPMLRRVAEQLARIDRQAREMDRFK